jgi:hypothetical protein
MDGRVYASVVSETHALDTDTADLGAPGKPGEIRPWHDVTYGIQFYRLLLNESGGAFAIGEGAALGAGTAWAGATVSGKNGVATVRERFGGVAQVAVADDFWFWALIEGEGRLLVADAGGVVAGSRAFGAAAGAFDDGAAGTIPVGLWLAAGADAALVRALLTRA